MRIRFDGSTHFDFHGDAKYSPYQDFPLKRRPKIGDKIIITMPVEIFRPPQVFVYDGLTTSHDEPVFELDGIMI